MARHSKWHQIKRKKATVDAKRSKLFTQLATHVAKTARSEKDPDKNRALADAINKAKAARMPQTKIDHLLHQKRNTAAEQEILYEAVGPQGTALLIAAVTNNSRRTISELRTIMEKHHGKMGENGSVRWKFKPQIDITTPLPAPADEELLQLALIDAGASTIERKNDGLHIQASRELRERIITTLASYKVAPTKEIQGYHSEQLQPLTATERHELAPLLNTLKKHPDVAAVYADADY